MAVNALEGRSAVVVDLSASERRISLKRGELPRAGYVVGGRLVLEATASQSVFHALSTITTCTLDILPHIEDTFFSCVTRRHSGYHHSWHATRSYYTHTQHALAIVGSHGHLSDRLRLHHQDGVGRGLCAITGRCQDEDPVTGQRDCTRIPTFCTAKLLTPCSRCPLFPQPPPSPPYSITMST